MNLHARRMLLPKISQPRRYTAAITACVDKAARSSSFGRLQPAALLLRPFPDAEMLGGALNQLVVLPRCGFVKQTKKISILRFIEAYARSLCLLLEELPVFPLRPAGMKRLWRFSKKTAVARKTDMTVVQLSPHRERQ
ncbi:hypothetical protein D3C78_1243710 [compost metagenome]